MELNKNSINEFKQIYLDEYGIKLSDEEAKQKSQNFLSLLQLITQNNPLKLSMENKNRI